MDKCKHCGYGEMEYLYNCVHCDKPVCNVCSITDNCPNASKVSALQEGTSLQETLEHILEKLTIIADKL
jgi:hypothetical protein